MKIIMEPLEFYLVVMIFSENDLTTIAKIAKKSNVYSLSTHVYSCLVVSSHVYSSLVKSTPCLLPVYSVSTLCLLMSSLVYRVLSRQEETLGSAEEREMVGSRLARGHAKIDASNAILLLLLLLVLPMMVWITRATVL